MINHNKIKQAEAILRQAQRELDSALAGMGDRRRGQALRDLHRIARFFEESPRYFSQSGQDRVVDRLLDEKTGGVFVDVGGYDGVQGSNTLFFELFRGWSGLLVEASPTQLEKAAAVRRCPCIGCAVGGTDGQAEFVEVTQGLTQMSGIVDTYAPGGLDHVRADPRHEEVIHSLEMRTLASILDEHGISQVDYLSLDVEGAEMSILESFPFKRYDIALWSIENNSGKDYVSTLMRARGYELVEYAGADELYRKR